MKKKRKNIDEFEHLGSIIHKVLGTYGNEFDSELIKVWSLWESVVGEAIAKNARPAAFKGKLLLVHVTSSTWTHQLQFLKKDIITKINDALGKELVEEIRFKVGPV